jgi:hypothetical protein
VFASLAGRTSPGNLILVTHAQNIQELTGISPSSGELIVVALEGPDRFKVTGCLEVQSIQLRYCICPACVANGFAINQRAIAGTPHGFKPRSCFF